MDILKEEKEEKDELFLDVFESLKLYKKFGKKRILLVDDEEFCMTTMIALLQACAIDTDNLVDSCINGQEALDKIIDASNNDI